MSHRLKIDKCVLCFSLWVDSQWRRNVGQLKSVHSKVVIRFQVNGCVLVGSPVTHLFLFHFFIIFILDE